MKRLHGLLLTGMVLASLLVASCTSQSPSKVRVATDATWPPFEYVNEQTKQIEGFDIDLFKAIAAKQKLDVEFINVGFDPLLAGMATGQYDAAISSITITEDRKKDMLFSDSYFAAGQMVVVQKSNTAVNSKDDLKGTVGAQLATTGVTEAEKIAGVTAKTYDDIGLAFQDLMNGQTVAVICDNPVAQQYVNQNPDKLRTAGSVFTDEQYGIAVAKGKTELLNKINAGLKAVKSEGTIDQLSKKWLK